MVSLTEMVANDKDYPDDMKLDFGNGEVRTFGEFRKDYRSKDADYRQKTSKLSDDRRQFDDDRRKLEEERGAQRVAFLEAENKLTEWTKSLMEANPGLTRQEATEELADDPRYKKLTAKLDSLEKGLVERDKKLDELANTVTLDQRMRLVQAHQYTLNQLKASDPDLDGDELVKFAQDSGIPRLDHAYTIKHFERILDRKTKEAVEAAVPKAIEKAKRDFSQPMLPTTRLIKPPTEAPKSMDQARDMALQDQEILNLLLSPTN